MAADSFPADPAVHVSQPGGRGRLQTCIEELYDTSLGELAHPDPVRGYQAIARLSGHLAAVRKALLPVAGRQFAEPAPHTGSRLVATCRAESRKAEWALRGVECLLSGQSRAVRMPPGSAHTLVEHRFGGYRAAESALLARLDGCLDAREHTRLTADYHIVLATAPTRPHPRCPHTGPLAGLMFRMCALRDRVLDALDSRPPRP